MKKLRFQRKYVGVPYFLFLILFVVLPILIICVYAFTDKDWHFTFENFALIFTRAEAMTAVVKSIGVGLVSTAACLLIGYPVAYFLATNFKKKGGVLMTLFILPMWMNFLLRTLAMRGIFDYLRITPGYFTTMLGMVYNFLPFMILPIYNQLAKMDKSYIEAAKDLGCNNREVFFKTVVPLSMPGVMSGITMVFMPCISTFVISDMLSRNTIQLFGNLINQAYKMDQWNYAAALSTLMLVVILISTLVTNRLSKEEEKKSLW